MVHDISIENQCLNWYFVIVNDPIEIAIEKNISRRLHSDLSQFGDS